jgi:hypothetical protein
MGDITKSYEKNNSSTFLRHDRIENEKIGGIHKHTDSKVIL